MPRSSGGRSSRGRRSSRSSKSSEGWSWGSSGSSKSSGKSAARASSHNAPPVKQVATTHSTSPAPSQDNNGSEKGSKMSFLDAIKEGIGFGAGNSIGHRIADSLFGPRVIRYEAVSSSAPNSAQDNKTDDSVVCSDQFKSFLDCVYSNASDISKCQFYMDMLQECRIGSGAAAALNA